MNPPHTLVGLHEKHPTLKGIELEQLASSLVRNHFEKDFFAPTLQYYCMHGTLGCSFLNSKYADLHGFHHPNGEWYHSKPQCVHLGVLPHLQPSLKNEKYKKKENMKQDAKKSSEIPGLKTAVYFEKGKRSTMEDYYSIQTHVVLNPSSKLNGISSQITMIAVYDGHGGFRTAKILSEKLMELVIIHLKKGRTPPQALTKSFLALDREICHPDNQDDSGSTCCMVLYDQQTRQYWCANTGDSRAVLLMDHFVPTPEVEYPQYGSGYCILHEKKTVNISFDHTPKRESEWIRIYAAGGFVSSYEGRLMGDLAVSRAFGDKSMKRTLYPFLRDEQKSKVLIVSLKHPPASNVQGFGTLVEDLKQWHPQSTEYDVKKETTNNGLCIPQSFKEFIQIHQPPLTRKVKIQSLNSYNKMPYVSFVFLENELKEDAKNEDVDVLTHHLIAEPEIVTGRIPFGSLGLFVLATDGFWDTVSTSLLRKTLLGFTHAPIVEGMDFDSIARNSIQTLESHHDNTTLVLLNVSEGSTEPWVPRRRVQGM